MRHSKVLQQELLEELNPDPMDDVEFDDDTGPLHSDDYWDWKDRNEYDPVEWGILYPEPPPLFTRVDVLYLTVAKMKKDKVTLREELEESQSEEYDWDEFFEADDGYYMPKREGDFDNGQVRSSDREKEG